MDEPSPKDVKTNWPSVKAKRLLAALLRIGWKIKRQTGSHRTLERPGFDDELFAFHDGDEIGSVMVRKISRKTGLKPKDL